MQGRRCARGKGAAKCEAIGAGRMKVGVRHGAPEYSGDGVEEIQP